MNKVTTGKRANKCFCCLWCTRELFAFCCLFAFLSVKWKDYSRGKDPMEFNFKPVTTLSALWKETFNREACHTLSKGGLETHIVNSFTTCTSLLKTVKKKRRRKGLIYKEFKKGLLSAPVMVTWKEWFKSVSPYLELWQIYHNTPFKLHLNTFVFCKTC